VDHTIHFGKDSELLVDLDPDQLVAHGGRPVTRVDSISAKVHEILENPLDYPPLVDWVVPGDRAAIVIDPSVPSAAQLVVGVMTYLTSIDRQPAHISIVLPEHGDKIRDEIQQMLASSPNLPVSPDLPGSQDAPELEFVLHDAEDQDQLSFLMANQQGEAVYLNRTLTDADLVIPILLTRLERSLGYRGGFSGIFPTYSDSASRKRLAEAFSESQRYRAGHRGETNEVGFSLGLQFLVQVVPGNRGEVLDVLAGEAKTVQQAAYQLAEQQWSVSTEYRADIVIASLGGANQDWDALARLLFQVESFGEDEAVIVLCTEIASAPGRAIHCLRELAVDPDATLREIRSQNSDDMLAAILLGQLMEAHQVFLLSGLDPDLVEDLGLGVLSDSQDLSRLCRGRTVTIIEDAQLVQPAFTAST
jgi:nickel-dependent lactate racemase